MDLKKVIMGWIASIFGVLLGGFLLCFQLTIPFAIVLIVMSGILFVCLGALALFINAGCL
jgi:hypothetical protein